MSGSISGLGSVSSLADLGVTVNSDGSLALDTTTLQSAYAADPDAVQAFFSTKTTGFAAQLDQTIQNLASSQSTSAVSSRRGGTGGPGHGEPGKITDDEPRGSATSKTNFTRSATTWRSRSPSSTMKCNCWEASVSSNRPA